MGHIFKFLWKVLKFIAGAMAIIAVIYGIFFLYESKYKKTDKSKLPKDPPIDGEDDDKDQKKSEPPRKSE